MSTMTLLPCPFCGGEPEIVRAQDEDGRFAAVGCPHCGAGSRQHYFVGDDAVPHVVSAWNRRAHLAQPAQAVDVGAIREVIKRLEEHPLSDEWKVFDQCADKLTRALSGEKAGPVGGIAMAAAYIQKKADDYAAEETEDGEFVEYDDFRAALRRLDQMHELVERARRAEAERDELRRRIEDAPTYFCPLSKPDDEAGWLGLIQSCKALKGIQGKRVRLVVDE